MPSDLNQKEDKAAGKRSDRKRILTGDAGAGADEAVNISPAQPGLCHTTAEASGQES